jgi:ATP-binding cassette subfamily F protein 3
VRWGAKVEIGYYAQQLEDLDDRNEVIMELRRVALSSATAGELRAFLAKFLFFGDDVYKHVRDLSGGEKGRLSLAKLIYSRVNVLVLDEPTNHLDIPSREALEAALDAYEGTIITISHDRYFLDRVATQILALDGRGHAEHYHGDYTEYHDWKATRSKAANELDSTTSAGPGSRVTDVKGPAGPRPADLDHGRLKANPKGAKSKAREGKKAKQKAESRRIKVIKKKAEPRGLKEIEAEISKLEQSLSELSQEMAKPEAGRDVGRLITLNNDYQEVEVRLSRLYEDWAQLAETARA